MSHASMLSRALAYARFGWPIVPIYEPRSDGTCTCERGVDCKRPGRHPRFYRGLRAASNDLARVTHWWILWPSANIGLNTSLGLVVDIDGPEGRRSLAALTRHGALPATVEATTACGLRPRAGRHDHEPSSWREDRYARSRGYVILAPSRHSSGRRYRWRRSPFTHELAVAPPWLVEALSKIRPRGGKHRRDAVTLATPW